MFTVGLLVIFSAILLLHVQEFTGLIRKLTLIPGVNLLVPIAFASWFIETYEEWSRWFLLYSRARLHNSLQVIADLLPFQMGSLYFVRITSLCLLACVPAWIFWFNTKYRGLYGFPKISYYFSAVLWIIAGFLLII